jgi:hypothetical protein
MRASAILLLLQSVPTKDGKEVNLLASYLPYLRSRYMSNKAFSDLSCQMTLWIVRVHLQLLLLILSMALHHFALNLHSLQVCNLILLLPRRWPCQHMEFQVNQSLALVQINHDISTNHLLDRSNLMVSLICPLL